MPATEFGIVDHHISSLEQDFRLDGSKIAWKYARTSTERASLVAPTKGTSSGSSTAGNLLSVPTDGQRIPALCRVFQMTTTGLLPMAKAAFDALSGFERPIVLVKGAGELSGIIDAGYARVFGGLGVHPWFHTAEDTLDKTDPVLLLPMLHAHMRFIAALVASAS